MIVQPESASGESEKSMAIWPSFFFFASRAMIENPPGRRVTRPISTSLSMRMSLESRMPSGVANNG